MEVRIEDVSPVEKKMVVEVPWATVAGKLGDAYRELAKTVNLKGFRKGKVPRSVLERMFGARVKAEVAVQLVRESFLTATTEHQLDAVSEPKLDEPPTLKKGQPVAFEAIVEVKGEVVVENYDGMELNKRPLNVPVEQVDEALANLQREHTALLPIEDREMLQDSDVASISATGTVGEHPIDRPQLVVDLGDAAHSPLPGLVEALLELPIATSEHVLSFKVPDDAQEAELKGQDVELTISVLDARQKDIPALDDEFAKDTGRAESLDELTQTLRNELEAGQKEQIDNELRDAALKELVKRNQIPVAQSLVDRVIHNKFHRLQSMLGIQDPSHDHAGFTDDLREKLAEGAEDDVRGQLLVDAVATAESVEVSEEDVDKRIEHLANMHGQKAGKLRADMDRDGRLESLRFSIRHDKALDILIERATVTEKEPEPEPEPEAASEE